MNSTHRELFNALERVRGKVRLSRGRGASHLPELSRRLHKEEVQMDEQTARAVAYIIESLVFAVEDEEAQKNRYRNQPWRGVI